MNYKDLLKLSLIIAFPLMFLLSSCGSEDVYMGNTSMNIAHGGRATSFNDEIYYVNGTEFYRIINGDQMSIKQFEDPEISPYDTDRRNESWISCLNVKDGWLYFCVGNSEEGLSNGIWRMKTDGSNAELLIEGYPTQDGMTSWQDGLHLVGDRLIYSDCFDEYGSLWWRDGEMITSVDLEGGDRQTVYTSPDVEKWTTDGSYLYCVYTDGKIGKRDLFADGECNEIADIGTTNGLSELYVVDGTLYLEIFADTGPDFYRTTELYTLDEKKGELKLAASIDEDAYTKGYAVSNENRFLIRGSEFDEDFYDAADVGENTGIYVLDEEEQLLSTFSTGTVTREQEYSDDMYPWRTGIGVESACLVNNYIFVPSTCSLSVESEDGYSYEYRGIINFTIATDIESGETKILSENQWDTMYGEYGAGM